MAEQMTLFDADRAPLGKTVSRGTALQDGEHILVVHVCIFNRAGELLLQQRSASKKSYPGYWDVSVAGGVRAGETGREAAARETREELGLSLAISDSAAVTLAFPGGFDVFYIVQNETPLSALTLQAEEVQSVRWATREEVIRLLHADAFAPYWESFLNLLFDLNSHLGLSE